MTSVETILDLISSLSEEQRTELHEKLISPWESYNQWQCFDLSVVDFTCADYDYGTLVPGIRAEAESEFFLFDTHVEDRLNCEQTLLLWQNLTAGSREICVFAAHMPDVDLGLDKNKPQSLWYINRLKGVGGYWDLHESSPEFSSDDSEANEGAY